MTAYVSRAAIMAADEARALKINREVERLDFLQSRWWTAATEGVLTEQGEEREPIMVLDEKAANIVLKTIMARAKLLGLDAPSADAGTRIQTIVINGSTEEYVAGLKALTDGDESRSTS